jgi:twitching motility protein PilT
MTHPDALLAVVPQRTLLSSLDDVNRLVARAAATGDSVVFLRSGAVPAMKVNGRVRWLDEFEPLDPDTLHRALADVSTQFRPDNRSGRSDAVCWTVPETAVVECRQTTGASGLELALTVLPTQPVPAANIGIPPALADVCRDQVGLVILAGSDATRLSRTCHSLIDLINGERAQHVIVLEATQVICHRRRVGYVSRRIFNGGDEAGRTLGEAIAEKPDVLVIDCPLSPQSVQPLLAYAADALVIVTTTERSAIGALKTLIDDLPADDRIVARRRLASVLTAVAAQQNIVSRGTGTGSPAYELILGTAHVRDLVGRGALGALALALERGIDGMISMSTAVANLNRQPQPQPTEERNEAVEQREETVDLSDAL